MHNVVSKMAAAASLFMALSVVGSGCAGDVGDINRVQPGYVKKADLLNKSWYYRRTVVDSPVGMGPNIRYWTGVYTGIGMGDLYQMERIRWDIQENTLIGYTDYEYTPGSEEGEYEGNDTYKGSPIVAFPIKKHFDIIRQYNPSTNEETNVIGENASDRMWHEREFVRVDWDKMSVTGNNMFILPVDILDTNNQVGGNFFVHQDEASNPWHARLTPENDYFDFVVNHFIMPDVYTCYLEYDFAMYDIWDACGSGEIRVRHAFMVVDDEKNAGYEALYYPDTMPILDDNGNEIPDPGTGEVLREEIFGRFGYFRIDRPTYDDQRGVTESGRLDRIIRFDIWKNSKNEDGSLIPYADRTPDPIIYYTNWDFPTEMAETAQEVGEEWNDIFRDTVASLQGKSKDDVQDMFIVHPNSCNVDGLTAYLDAHKSVKEKVEVELDGRELLNDEWLRNWCSAAEYHSAGENEPFLWEQIGDPRFNMLYWITNPNPATWSGYGPMFADPITGRNVTSSAFLMGNTINASATQAVEYVEYILGELSMWDILRGENVPIVAPDGSYDPIVHTHDLNSVVSAARAVVSDEHLDDLRGRFANIKASGNAMPRLANSNQYSERMNRVIGTELERDYLLRSEDVMLATRGEWMPGDALPSELVEEASYLRRSEDIRVRQEATARKLRMNTIFPEYNLDSNLIAFAEALRDMTHDEKYQAVRKMIFKAVATHEVGHNVGLRHNFEASWDALNFFPEFWDIEASEGGEPEDQDAKDALGQSEYMYTSIMDYHGKVNADFQGAGSYDRAAIKFGYGQIIESFKDSTVAGGDALREFRFYNDYKKLLPNPTDGGYFASTAAVWDREDVIFDWNDKEVMKKSNLDAMKASEVPYLFCSDEYSWDEPTCRVWDFGANHREQTQSNIVAYKNYFIFNRYLRNRMTLNWDRAQMRGQLAFFNTVKTFQYFYRYNVLENEDGEFLNTDLGVDMATAVKSGINFMSEIISVPRVGKQHRCVVDEGGPDESVIFYPGYYIEHDVTTDCGDPDDLVDDPDGSGGTVADVALCDELDGNETPMGVGLYGETCYMNTELDITLGEGYPLYFGFNEEFVKWTFTYLGTYWDKMAAMQFLTYPVAQFPRMSQQEDWDTYYISMYRLYDKEINDLFLSLIEYDPTTAGGWVEEEGPGENDARRIIQRTMLDNEDMEGKARYTPAMARNLQLYAMLFGAVYLTSDYSNTLDFVKHVFVALEGSPEDMDAFQNAAAADLATCTLPESGLTYKAMRTNTLASKENPRVDIGFNFVNQCDNLVGMREIARTDWDTAITALAAGDSTDTAAYQALTMAEVEAERDWDWADGQLRVTEQALQFMRLMHSYYEYGAGF